jgi:hypothetical protein
MRRLKYALGRTCRLACVGVAAALVLATCVLTALGLGASVVAAGRRYVTPDILAAPPERADAVVATTTAHTGPAGMVNVPVLWAWRPHRPLVGAIATDKNRLYIRVLAPDQPGAYPWRLTPNPYAGWPVNERWAQLFLWPRGARMVLIDTRALPAVETVAAMAEDARVGYLAWAPAEQYDAIRARLRDYPPGPVLSAESGFARSPEPAALRKTLRIAVGRLGRKPVVLTRDPAWPAMLGEYAKVLLIGSGPGAVSPSAAPAEADRLQALE